MVNGIPVMQRPTLFATHMIGTSDFGHSSPLTTYTNTLSWTKGTHAIKTGVELRLANSASRSGDILPKVNGGAGDVPVRGIDQVSGMLPPNITLAQNLLLALSGSVESIDQWFEIREPTQTRFLDFRDAYSDLNDPTARGVHDHHQNEFNVFIKDDWKVTPGFTLNLGLRWDLMRVPYMLNASGKNLTPGYLGGNEAIYGYSGRSIADWGELTQAVLICKCTPYPQQ
jgi:hypothetical protein